MPETLQKLHESSKTLETNQTAISQKIYEVQQRIETVEKEVSLDFEACQNVSFEYKKISLLSEPVFTA